MSTTNPERAGESSAVSPPTIGVEAGTEGSQQAAVVQKIRKAAIHDMQLLLPRLHELASRVGNSVLLAQVEAFTAAARTTLQDTPEQTHASDRDARLVAWAGQRGVSNSTNPHIIRGRLIVKIIATWIETAEQLLNETDRTTVIRVSDLKNAIFRIARALAQQFDPQIHGDSFRDYAEPYVLAGLRQCIAADALVIPENITAAQLEALLQLQQPVQQEAEAAEPGEGKKERGKEKEEEGRAEEPMEKEAFALAVRLVAWAQTHDDWEPGLDTAHMIRGKLIRDTIARWLEDAEQMRAQAGITILSPRNLEDAIYHIAKALAKQFDPQVHGDSFRMYAAPYVLAGLRMCLAENALVIPAQLTGRQLEALLKQDQRGAGRQHPAVAPAGEEEDGDKSASEPHEAAPPVSAATDETQHPPSVPESEAVPPKEPTGEERMEAKRQRRFCRYARDELHIENIEENQFEDAVRKVCGHYQGFVNTVLKQLTIPSSFRGGKQKLRTEGRRLLLGIVRTFDPAGEEHFNQFVMRQLQPQLEAILKGGR